MHHKVALELPICLYRWARVVNHGHVWDMPRPRVAGTMAQVLPLPPPPPCQWPGPCFFFRGGGGGGIGKGGHVSSFEGGVH